MCVHKAWNLQYDAIEMTTATNDGSIGWLLWKLLFDGKEMKLLIAKDLNLLRGDFSDGENECIFGCWLGFYPIPGFPIKVQGKGG